MKKALIGHSGFVGGTLRKQTSFDAFYRSTDIGEIEGREFDTVVCAGAPAQKWLANKNPEDDLRRIDGLIGHLSKVRCKKFILISTIDVFGSPLGVDEDSPVETTGLHPYGLHRRKLEEFVMSHFSNHLVVRLPGLVGPGLRKNVIFDFLNDNNTSAIDSRGVFQFYPMVNLWPDILTAEKAGLNLIHLTAEPVSVARIAKDGFDIDFDRAGPNSAARYDMRSRHAGLFGGVSPYQYDARTTVLAVRAYAQSEPLTPKVVG